MRTHDDIINFKESAGHACVTTRGSSMLALSGKPGVKTKAAADYVEAGHALTSVTTHDSIISHSSGKPGVKTKDAADDDVEEEAGVYSPS